MIPVALGVLVAIFAIVGGLLKGPIGALGGGIAAVLVWIRFAKLREAIEDDRARRERGEPRITRSELVMAIAAALAVALVFAASR